MMCRRQGGRATSPSTPVFTSAPAVVGDDLLLAKRAGGPVLRRVHVSGTAGAAEKW